jgi:hypothetical protein
MSTTTDTTAPIVRNAPKRETIDTGTGPRVLRLRLMHLEERSARATHLNSSQSNLP